MQSGKPEATELINLFRTLTPEEADKVLQFVKQLKEQRGLTSK